MSVVKKSSDGEKSLFQICRGESNHICLEHCSKNVRLPVPSLADICCVSPKCLTVPCDEDAHIWVFYMGGEWDLNP